MANIFDTLITRANIRWGVRKIMRYFIPCGSCILKTLLYIGRIKQMYFKLSKCNITVTYSNFCARNFCAPINIKLKVLHACVISSLCYGSETRGKHTSSQLESPYKMGIKTALSVRFNTYDDIIYIESGSYSTACSIKKRQIKFWFTLKRRRILICPTSPTMMA